MKNRPKNLTQRILLNAIYAIFLVCAATCMACGGADDEGAAADFQDNPSTSSWSTGGGGSTGGSTSYTSTSGATSTNGSKGWLYVLIEDLSEETEGSTPGADLDAISVILADTGEELFATTVDDFNVTQEDNPWSDPQEVLGKPDSECSLQGFVSLGGMEEDGYLIVGFSTVDREVRIKPGDTIKVYELGESICPEQEDWEDDPYSVSLSLSDDRETFLEVGSSVEGKNTILIEQ